MLICQILSDLHIDSYGKRQLPLGQIPKTDADVILVAGDTANGDAGMLWLQEQSQRLGKPIITIAGNHEYFYQDVLSFDKVLQSYNDFTATDSLSGLSCQYQGVKFLQCEAVDMGSVRILGCTFWTDYQYQCTEDTMRSSLAFMRDYQCIYCEQNDAKNDNDVEREVDKQIGLFTPEISVKLHKQQRAWLMKALKQAHIDGMTAIVMTHHSISPLSISDKYRHLPSNAAFVSDMSEWMHMPWSPKLWVHGHTHEAFDYRLGNTRVVVNPRAYPGEISSTSLAFDWHKTVRI